jgi:4-phospho-D-threonate 3-dehydrogenase / 4-phospho-D-erythronate 3-dehydrogenase
MATKKPIIGISMGDPSGIGPEIAVKALARKEIYTICKPLIVGDSSVIKDALRMTGLDLEINSISAVREAKFQLGTLDVYDLKNVNMAELQYGKVSAMSGEAAFEAIKKVIELAQKKEIDATVTGPINKESINLAGHHYSGHTEIYADFTHTQDYTMMLAHENLRVVHVSTHVSLKEACERVRKDRVLKVIKLANEACRKIGIAHPRIGVAGLNPHAGESGLFGREEIEEIIPAIEAAKALGINADGPIPPDSLFSKAKGGLYDIVVAMYHDQGHIPLKVVGFNWNEEKQKWDSISGVNITLGLPIIRSSVDHGTAFGKAGKGTASELSLVHAIEYAVKMALA